MIITGKMEMTNESCRHDRNDPIKNEKNNPRLAAIVVNDNNTPRIDFSLDVKRKNTQKSLTNDH